MYFMRDYLIESEFLSILDRLEFSCMDNIKMWNSIQKCFLLFLFPIFVGLFYIKTETISTSLKCYEEASQEESHHEILESLTNSRYNSAYVGRVSLLEIL
jgi:hypothetical protein